MKTPHTMRIALQAYAQAMSSPNAFSEAVSRHVISWLENHHYIVLGSVNVRSFNKAIVVSIQGDLKREHERHFSYIVTIGKEVTKLVIQPEMALSEDSILNDL